MSKQTPATPPAAPNPNTPAPIDLNNPIDLPKALERVLYARADRDIAPYLEGTGITVGRFVRTVVHAVAANPELLKLDGASIVMSVLEAARMGLEPVGRFGGAYLIPRGGKAVLEVDWRGFIRMAQREGAIRSASADPVYEGDHFEYTRGTHPNIDHRPTRGPSFGEPERGDVTHFYAILWFPDGSFVFEVMTRAEVDAIRSRSSAKDRGPWVSDYIEMGRKTAVRRVFKYVPAVYNPGLQFALEREDAIEGSSTFQDERDDHRTPRRSLASAIIAGDAEPPAEQEQGGDPPAAPSGEDAERAKATDPEEGLPS